MSKKIVPVYVGGGRMLAVLIRDIHEQIECPWCGCEIKIGKNKFGLNMAIEMTRTFGWRPHKNDCHEFCMKKLDCEIKKSNLKLRCEKYSDNKKTNYNVSENNDARHAKQNFYAGKTVC